MQRSSKLPIILLVTLVVAVAVGGWWWRTRNQSRLSYTTTTVKRGDIAATITATGTIEPIEVVDVGAQVAGRISSFGSGKDGKTIDYGSIVEQGAVLATIEDSVYAADLAVASAQLDQEKAREISAKANLEQTKAKMIQAESEWNRATELNSSKLLATADYDSYKASFAVAKANVAVAEAALVQAKASTVQAQAAIEKAQRNLEFCTIRSPVGGVIIDRRVNIGQTVVASLNAPSLFLIAKDLTKMQIWVAVNEADVGRIVPGAPITFTCDAFPGREFDGSIGKVRLNATMTQNVVMYTVEVNTDNSKKILLPYLTANVRFILNTESNVRIIPNAALRWSPSIPPSAGSDTSLPKVPAQETSNATNSTSKPSKKNKGTQERIGTVWVKEGETIRAVEIKLGISDGINTAILGEELSEGQEVITGEFNGSSQSGSKNPFLPKVIRR